MSKKKQLGLGLVIGLLAMAFAALPAMANAAPELTTSKEAAVSVGTTVTATSTNAVTVLEKVGTLTCTSVTINGIVEENTGTKVKIGMDKETDSATGCLLSGVLPVEVKPTVESIILTSTSKTANFSFKSPTLGATETASNAAVTYTGPKATKIHVAGPVVGTATGSFSGDFTLAGGITVD